VRRRGVSNALRIGVMVDAGKGTASETAGMCTYSEGGQLSRNRVRDRSGAGRAGTDAFLAKGPMRIPMEAMGLGAAGQKGSSDSRVQMHGCCVGI